MSKRCFRCGTVKPLDEFYVHPQMGDGHLGKCKECTKADVKQRYLSRPEAVQAYERTRMDDPGRREKSRQYGKTRREKYPEVARKLRQLERERHPEKGRARRKLSQAIKSGLLERGACEGCGTKENVHAHHTDYFKPLDVTWLCSVCHGKAHRKWSASA